MNLGLAAVVRSYESSMRNAERLARQRRDLAIESAFNVLDLNSNGFVDLMELSALLQRISRPLFSVFDNEENRALNTAHTMHALQRMLEGDTALPVRGLGLGALEECVRTLTLTLTLTLARALTLTLTLTLTLALALALALALTPTPAQVRALGLGAFTKRSVCSREPQP